ncbi:hypothetical protein SESBI_47052 [Sesbania bispinosa]|nr:hypothetical protein SESBI_47052 [Sesbania bispinosa]
MRWTMANHDVLQTAMAHDAVAMTHDDRAGAIHGDEKLGIGSRSQTWAHLDGPRALVAIEETVNPNVIFYE